MWFLGVAGCVCLPPTDDSIISVACPVLVSSGLPDPTLRLVSVGPLDPTAVQVRPLTLSNCLLVRTLTDRFARIIPRLLVPLDNFVWPAC